MQKFKAYLPLIAGVILIIATFMIFLPGVIQKTPNPLGGDFTVDYSGLQVVFGQAENPKLEFNVGVFIGWVFMFGAGVVSLIGALNKKLGVLVLVGVGVAIVGSVLVFLEAVFFKSANDFSSIFNTTYNLGIGPILGGIFGIIGTASAGYAGFKALLSK